VPTQPAFMEMRDGNRNKRRTTALITEDGFHRLYPFLYFYMLNAIFRYSNLLEVAQFRTSKPLSLAVDIMGDRHRTNENSGNANQTSVL
jgi:hypothetical protein